MVFFDFFFICVRMTSDTKIHCVRSIISYEGLWCFSFSCFFLLFPLYYCDETLVFSNLFCSFGVVINHAYQPYWSWSWGWQREEGLLQRLMMSCVIPLAIRLEFLLVVFLLVLFFFLEASPRRYLCRCFVFPAVLRGV